MQQYFFFQTSIYVCFIWKLTLDIAFGINLKNSTTTARQNNLCQYNLPSLRRRLHRSFRFTTKRWNYVWLREAWINTACLTNLRKEPHKNMSKDVLPGCRQLGRWHGKRDWRYAFKNLAADNTDSNVTVRNCEENKRTKAKCANILDNYAWILVEKNKF